MCGFAGFYSPNSRQGPESLERMAMAMANAVRYRGPDDEGCWADAGAGIALGHRRLSIVDLSPAGHQPMTSASGRFVIVYNGEIYNSLELRDELHEARFRGHSDTEVMLAAFERWGIEGAVRRFNGMFAFALWDRQERRLWLARDRMGEKPLYYGWAGQTFLFGSELKALRAHPAFNFEIDRNALALLMRHNCIPAPYSIYRGVRKLPPATLLSVSSDLRDTDPVAYWSVLDAVKAGEADPFRGSEAEATEQLSALLRDAVKLRMLSDVPLGAFLSGGIDSSTVVALMQAQSSRPVRTFSIGMPDAGYNEAEDAKQVAKHLGTEHTELYVTPEEALAVVPRLPEMYDEPFADSSQVPTFLVAKLARPQVTVGLSGDGGDELFGGYNRYVWNPRVWRSLRPIPRAARMAGAAALRTISPAQWDGVFRSFAPVLPKAMRQRMPGYKLHKLADAMSCSDARELYLRTASHWFDPASVVPGGEEPPTLITTPSTVLGQVQEMMYLDGVTYLPDDILVKLDRATMAVSLEGRVPFLDHRVVEFSWRLPLHMKIRDGQGKWLLRQVLYKHVPRQLIERPKMGFGIPLENWLRGPLRTWAEDLLSESRMRQEGFFATAAVREKWRDHLSGRRDWQYHLWDVLMFQAWLQAQSEVKTAPAAVHA